MLSFQPPINISLFNIPEISLALFIHSLKKSRLKSLPTGISAALTGATTNPVGTGSNVSDVMVNPYGFSLIKLVKLINVVSDGIMLTLGDT